MRPIGMLGLTALLVAAAPAHAQEVRVGPLTVASAHKVMDARAQAAQARIDEYAATIVDFEVPDGSAPVGELRQHQQLLRRAIAQLQPTVDAAVADAGKGYKSLYIRNPTATPLTCAYQDAVALIRPGAEGDLPASDAALAGEVEVLCAPYLDNPTVGGTPVSSIRIRAGAPGLATPVAAKGLTGVRTQMADPELRPGFTGAAMLQCLSGRPDEAGALHPRFCFVIQAPDLQFAAEMSRFLMKDINFSVRTPPAEPAENYLYRVPVMVPGRRP